MRPDAPRALTAGPDGGPEPPFPLRLNGRVVKGFGRGSSELGIPTANIPIAGLSVGGHDDVESGVYFGWAGLDVDETGNRIPIPTASSTITSRGKDAANGTVAKPTDGEQSDGAPTTSPSTLPNLHIYPMVMSIGWNPFYKNTVRSVEVHLLHSFPEDFYGAWMNLLIVGFIRPEYDYVSKDALIEDIRTDIEVARRSLGREGYATIQKDAYLYISPEGETEVGS